MQTDAMYIHNKLYETDLILAWQVRSLSPENIPCEQTFKLNDYHIISFPVHEIVSKCNEVVTKIVDMLKGRVITPAYRP